MSQIETGAIKCPAPNLLLALAGVYELDLRELMDLAGIADDWPFSELRMAQARDRIAELEALAHGMLAAVTASADLAVESEWLAFFRRSQVQAWRDTLAGTR